MIRSKTRWEMALLDEAGERKASELSSALSLPPIVARLLVKRGIDELEAANNFLHGGLECLHDPFGLKGMTEAAGRIRLAAERKERVRIYGDYDADGVSATTLMIYLFERLGLQFDYYIPHRTLEGYGLNNKAIDAAHEAGVSLIVTVDTGVSAVDEIAYAHSLGIDVVVTDHHEPPHRLPDACALINPKQEDCPYPFKGLAGVGVAFKLAHALLGEPPVEWTDIVALGTIADLMPLTDENRVLVRFGLERLKEGDKPGFRALADVAGIDRSGIAAVNIAFGMAPRINAAGRLEHARDAVGLLTANNDSEAMAAAFKLDALNKERQKIVEAIFKEAQSQWAAKCQRAADSNEPEPNVIVIAAEGWNVGVVGIVASKLIERFYKPTLVLGIDPETGMCKGSARSIDGFDLHAALTACDELLDHYGGHQAAAGMSLRRDMLEMFERRLCELAGEWLTDEDWIPKSTADIACGVQDITLEALEQLSRLEPFGAGNAAPKVLLGADLADCRTMGKENKHLKLTLAGEGRLLDAVGFGFGPMAGKMCPGSQIELLGELSVNEWNGNRRPQFMIHDLRIPHVQLYDARKEKLAKPFETLARLTAEHDIRSGVVLVPSAAWVEALEQSTAVLLPETLDVSTYEAWNAGERTAGRMIVLGKPPSADKLAEAIGQCRELEAIYAVYGKSAEEASLASRSGNDGAGVPASGRMPAGAVPDREQFGRLYHTLRRICPLRGGGHTGRLSVMMGWPEPTIQLMLGVFEELDFIRQNEGELILVESPVKKDLSHSVLYRDACRRQETDRILYAEAKELAEWLRRQVNKQELTTSEGVAVS